jgi:hypothetical protein
MGAVDDRDRAVIAAFVSSGELNGPGAGNRNGKPVLPHCGGPGRSLGARAAREKNYRKSQSPPGRAHMLDLLGKCGNWVRTYRNASSINFPLPTDAHLDHAIVRFQRIRRGTSSSAGRSSIPSGPGGLRSRQR